MQRSSFIKNLIVCLLEFLGRQIKWEFHAICLEVDVSGLGVINTILRNLAPFKKNARISGLKK